MRNVISSIAVVATCLAGVAFLPVAAAQTAGAAAPVKEKKICRREEVTGSILGSKAVCHTKSEWTQIDRANADGADRQLDRDRQLQNSGVGSSRMNGN